MRKTTLLLSFLSLAASGLLAQQYQGPDFSAAKFEMQSVVNRSNDGFSDSTVFSYNNRHMPLEQLSWRSEQGSAWEFAPYETQGFEWNDMGQQTKQYNPYQMIERTFDAGGLLTVESIYERRETTEDFTLTRQTINSYDDHGWLTKEQRLMTNLISGRSYVNITNNAYNADGTLASIGYESWSDTAEPTGDPEHRSITEFTYQPGSSVAVETVHKSYDNQTSQWFVVSSATNTLAKLPVKLFSDTDDYYAAKSVVKEPNGDACHTTEVTIEFSEADKTYTRREVSTSESQTQITEKSYLVTNFDEAANTIMGMLELNNITNVRQPGMESTQTMECKYDDANRLLERESVSETAYEGQEVRRNGDRFVNVYDDLGRLIETSHYVIFDGVSDFLLKDRTKVEYVDNTLAKRHVVLEQTSTPGEEMMVTGEETCEYDMSVPYSDIATFVYGARNINFRYMPLKVVYNGFGQEHATTYNYRAIESGIEGVGAGDAAYGVWPAVTTGELNVVVPEGVTPDVTVYSAGGAVVARSQSDRLQLDAVPAGFYIVKVNGHTTRIIKK